MDHKELLKELKECYKSFLASNRKNATLIDPKLHDVFSKAEKPYDHLYLLMRDLREFDQSKNTTLSVYILEFFEKFKKENGASQVIDKGLKEEVLYNICGRTVQITNTIIRLFEIDKETPENFMFLIDDLVHKQKYDVVCRLVSALRLHDKVSIFQLLIPLIGQDKVGLVESYLDQAGKSVQLELIQYLDSCLANRNQLKDKMIDLGVQQVRHEKLQTSILSKLVGRLAKKYEISDEYLPFFCRKRVGSSMRYLAMQCFKEGVITQANFEELTTREVQNSKDLQLDLLNILFDYRENALALKMARNLGLPPSDWPSELRDAENATSSATVEEDWTDESFADGTRDEVWGLPAAESDSSRSFYELPFPLNEVILIDSKDKFDEFLIGLSKEEIIGVDAEWPPSFTTTKTSVSVIQIATGTDKVYILDMVSLEESLSVEQRHGFVDQFYREGLLVLGFGLKDDLVKLDASFPAIHQRHETSSNVLDLLKLWGHIQSHHPTVLPYLKNGGDGKDRQKGLSELVRQCFDVSLDKREQMSPWARRPLTEAQIAYAAIDAYILLKVFKFLSIKFSPEEWKDLINMYTRKKKEQKPQKFKKERKPKSLIQRPIPISPFKDSQKTPEEVKMICVSSMLGRLGKLLRSCGIDTVFTHSKDFAMSDQEIVNLAVKEGRFVLGAGDPCQKLMEHLPPGHFYRVGSFDPAHQLKEILVFYNIKVELKHIFSRCQKCNSLKYHKVTQCRMMHILETTGIPPCPSHLASEKREEPAKISNDLMGDVVSCLATLSVNCSSTQCVCDMDASSTFEERNIVELNEALLSLGKTTRNATIQVKDVPMGVLRSVKVFFVCCDCGKVYWVGSHIRKALSGCLKYALINSDDWEGEE